MVASEVVLNSMRSGHGINGMELGVEYVLGVAGVELNFYIVASMRLVLGWC